MSRNRRKDVDDEKLLETLSNSLYSIISTSSCREFRKNCTDLLQVTSNSQMKDRIDMLVCKQLEETLEKRRMKHKHKITEQKDSENTSTKRRKINGDDDTDSKPASLKTQKSELVISVDHFQWRNNSDGQPSKYPAYQAPDAILPTISLNAASETEHTNENAATELNNDFASLSNYFMDNGEFIREE